MIDKQCIISIPVELLLKIKNTISRKLILKIKKISKNRILKGPNFIGLLGNSTKELVYIVNTIIEDAKENNKKFWLVLQNIKKAFDLVLLEALEKVMRRIKLSEVIITLVLNLFQRRQTRIITY